MASVVCTLCGQTGFLRLLYDICRFGKKFLKPVRPTSSVQSTSPSYSNITSQDTKLWRNTRHSAHVGDALATPTINVGAPPF